MDLGIEERRVIIEAIATLVNIKLTMAELILKPAGVPYQLYQPLLMRRDPITGEPLSKRQMAPLIIDALEKRSDCTKILRSIIEITANWNSFHLAKDEFAARATVHKARELLGTLETMEEREEINRELARKKELREIELKDAERLEREFGLLLMQFDELAKSDDAHRRGFLLQNLLDRLFNLYTIPVQKSFQRNEGAEQIDAAFRLDGWHYLVECRWRKKLADIRELDGLMGQVSRSGKQTMGCFLSINGWSENVPLGLKQNPQKSIILMDGYDLRCVLTRQIDLKHFIVEKITRLNLYSEPFYGASEYLKTLSEK